MEPRDPALAALFRATVRVANGSGVVISTGRAALVATAAHVVTEGEAPIVRRGSIFGEASVLARDLELDVALLTPPRELEGRALKLADDDEAGRPGDAVWAAGFPRGWEGSDPVLASGMVAGVGGQSWVNLDGTWGNSGGPICRLLEDGSPVVTGVLQGNAGKASAVLDMWDSTTKKMGAELVEFYEYMKGDLPPELGFWRGIVQLLASNMGMTEIVGELLRDHFRTGFLRFAPVADLRKLLG